MATCPEPIVAVNLVRNIARRVGALVEESRSVLEALGVAIEVNCLAVVEHVVFFVQVVASLLGQLFIEGKDKVVLGEAALDFGDGAANIEGLLRLV